MPSETIKPFKIATSEADDNRLVQRLRDTRHPSKDIVPGAGQGYGMPTEWALRLLDYWRTTYSWTKAQEQMNAFPQFTTEIESLNIHFISQMSSNSKAIPILLIHGWPGSFHEFSEVIDPLCDSTQGKHAFHCVVPSLPGFCYSSAPPKGWTVKDTARVFHTLMLRLGYEQYVVQAGDWGQFVARELGANPAYSDSCKAIHLNYCPGALPEELTDKDLSEREIRCRARGVDWRTNHVGYAVLMRTRPQTLGWMLQDNAVGLLAFVGEKYQEASSPAVHHETKWMDHILTTVCLYYFTGCIDTSGLIYYENTPHHLFASYAMEEENRIKCPFGYTSYAYDTAPNSKRAVERTGNLVFYNEKDYAGHFACLEDPDGIVEDIQQVVGKHWAL